MQVRYHLRAKISPAMDQVKAIFRLFLDVDYALIVPEIFAWSEVGNALVTKSYDLGMFCFQCLVVAAHNPDIESVYCLGVCGAGVDDDRVDEQRSTEA